MIALGLTLYIALGSAAAIIYPPIGVAFLLPVLVAIVRVAPEMRATPHRLMLGLLAIGCFLLPLWPTYLFFKLGPTPALIPPRLVLYVVCALWAYDMTFSRLRRGQFFYALKKGGPACALFFGLFFLGLISLPLAEGRSIAIPEFFRQSIIWLAPFCAIMTYCRRQRHFILLIKALTLAAVTVAAIALAEAATHQLLANLLSPFIADDAEWLRTAQALKIRDGAFRAQATHTHPLSLGEHLAFAAPFALAFALSANRLGARAFWWIAFAAIVLAAGATNSRGALLMITLSIGAMAGVLVLRSMKRASLSHLRPLAGLAFVLIAAASPVASVVAYAVISGKAGVSAANSTQSRIDQMEMAWPKIIKRPVLGYGTGRSTRVLGYWGRTLTLDNYYLTLALDLGFPGPLTFFTMLVAWSIGSLRRSMRSHPYLGVVYLAMAASILSIIIGRSIISQAGNLTVIYVMLAAYVGASANFSPRRSRNRIARPDRRSRRNALGDAA